MEKLSVKDQILTNPYKNLKSTPYRLVAAGAGPNNVTLPNGDIIDTDQLKISLKYPCLYAWNAEKKALLKFLEYKKLNENTSDLMIDSGAYSAWSKNKLFDIDEYIHFLSDNDILKYAFWAAEADKIPGSFGVDPTKEEILNAPKESWNNYLYMIERVKYPKKIIPIFHQGEDLFFLKQMLSYKFPDGEHIPYIGISPRNDVNVSSKIKWYEIVWKVIEDSDNKNVLTHNFGMTTLSVIEQYPSFSSDSTSWLRSGVFGNIQPIINSSVKNICISNRRIHDKDHINHKSKEFRSAVDKYCRELGYGFTLDALLNDDVGNLRPIFNLLSLNKWRTDFNFNGNSLYKEDIWS